MKTDVHTIHWLPWGDDALSEARKDDKPIYLFIHANDHDRVMEQECFTDGEIVSFLNEQFVPIKLDRDQKPDVVQFYCAALYAMSGTRGWPLSLFLTPNGDPFYGGTLFPRETQGKMASFLKVLHTIAETWKQDEELLTQESRHLSQHVKAELAREANP